MGVKGGNKGRRDRTTAPPTRSFAELWRDTMEARAEMVKHAKAMEEHMEALGAMGVDQVEASLLAQDEVGEDDDGENGDG